MAKFEQLLASMCAKVVFSNATPFTHELTVYSKLILLDCSGAVLSIRSTFKHSTPVFFTGTIRRIYGVRCIKKSMRISDANVKLLPEIAVICVNCPTLPAAQAVVVKSISFCLS